MVLFGKGGLKLAIGLGLVAVLSTGAQAHPLEGQRVFSFEDVLQRSEVEGAVASPDGASVAVQVTRPLAEPGVHAGAARSGVQPRGDIWLFDADLSSSQELPADDLWTWAPSYSPSGRKLAALYSDNDGRVGLVVWNLEDHSPTRFANIEVDVNAIFNSHGNPDQQPGGWALQTRPFVWIDDYTILFVDRNGVLQQYGLAPATATATYAALRGRTRSGQLSVRVWNERSPTEGAGSRLMTLDVRSGSISVLYEGDVRGASVSPDGAQAALLVATHHLRPTQESMEAPLRSWHLYDDNVAMILVIQSLGTSGTGRLVEGVELAGPASVSRLPLWSDDGRRVTLAGRQSYSGRSSSGDDYALEVQLPALEVRREPARSALDSELIANILAGSGARADQAIAQRPILASADNFLPLGQPPGRVWRFSTASYLLWFEGQLQVIGPRGSGTLPGRFDSVFAVHTTGVAPRFIVHRGGEHFDLRFIDGEPILRPMERPPLDEMLVASGVRGLTLYKRDGEDGTTLHLLRDGEPERSAMAFNQHLRAVVTPPARELHLELNGRRLTGVLRLPPGRRQTDRHPVVIRAYPGSLPAVGDRSHRVNSAASTYEPFQYLLARGFAVFIVPFPVELAPHPAGPLQMSVDAVLPWLEILDRQPEILAGEYAYWGHSNGGYVGLALATRATPFKAIAVSSTFPDLHWTLDAGLEFTPLDSAGEIMQVRRFVYEYDAQPYSLGAPPWRAQERWIRNSPVFNLDQAATPMLLIVGEFDFATPRPLERVYSTLRARGVPVEMAQYWGEAHVITSPENLFDSWTRAERFFKRYLRME